MIWTLAAMALGTGAIASGSAPSQEIEIEAPGPQGPLRGTLRQGHAGEPVVLIIPGSGPTNRDGNSPMGVAAAPYKLLAEGLAENGITTLRADKRGMFGSAAAIADANAVTVPDYVDDVRAWTDVLRKRTGAQCIWLLGHSEGGLIALAAAQEPGICGLLLVSTAGRPLGEVLRSQLRANPANAPVLGQALAAIDRLEAGQRVPGEDLHPALAPLFAPQVQGFLISLFSYDPIELVAGVRKPVLVLHGLRDIQVSEEDARRLAAANSGAQLVLLPEANHVLKRVASGDRAANIATYGDPSLPLADGVVDAIAGFLAEHRATGAEP